MLYQLSYIHRSRRGLYSGGVKMQALPRSNLGLICSVALAAGCLHEPTPRNQEVMEEIARTRHVILQHDVGFGPVVDFEPQTQTRDGVQVTAGPIRLEAEPWNVWPDGTARLFNDAVAFAVHVHIRGPGVRWDTAHTRLAVNTTEQVFAPAPAPDDALMHLFWLARSESRAGLPPDSELRLRNADGYRAAYLPTSRGPEATGMIVFPAPAARLFAVALELTLGVEVGGSRVEEFIFLFE